MIQIDECMEINEDKSIYMLSEYIQEWSLVDLHMYRILETKDSM